MTHETANDIRMSVVIIAPESFDTIRWSVRHWAEQTIAGQLELVIVAASKAGMNPPEAAVAPFAGVQVVEAPPFRSTAAARGVGVRAARGEIVAFAEDHSWPDPQWADTMLATHAGPYAAVGPEMICANPGNAISWANLIIEYGPWLEPAAAGPAEHLPGHNGAYKRQVLLQYGDRLERMLEAESVLQWDLRRQGHELYLEPRARTFHLNVSRLSSSFWLRFLGGRMFAAFRAENERWSAAKRLAYALAAPLIPWVRLTRIVRQLRRRAWRGYPWPSLAPSLVGLLALDAFGEAVGYLLGAGGQAPALADLEFDRLRYLNAEDRQLRRADDAATRAG